MNFKSMDFGLPVCLIGRFKSFVPTLGKVPAGGMPTFPQTAAGSRLTPSGVGIDMRRIDVSAAGRYGQFVEPAA